MEDHGLADYPARIGARTLQLSNLSDSESLDRERSLVFAKKTMA